MTKYNIQEFIVKYHNWSKFSISTDKNIHIGNRIKQIHNDIKLSKEFAHEYNPNIAYNYISREYPHILINYDYISYTTIGEINLWLELSKLDFYNDILFVKINNKIIKLSDWIRLIKLNYNPKRSVGEKIYHIDNIELSVVTNNNSWEYRFKIR